MRWHYVKVSFKVLMLLLICTTSSLVISMVTFAFLHFPSTFINYRFIPRAHMLMDMAIYTSIEGLKFYGDLARQKLDPLKQRLTDFSVARDIEKRMILDQLTSELAGYPGDSKTSYGGPVAPGGPGGPSGGSGGYGHPPIASAPSPWAVPSSYAPPPAANPNLAYETPSSPMYAFSGQPPTPAAPQQQPVHHQQHQQQQPLMAMATPVAMATPMPQPNASYAPQPSPAYSSYPPASAVAVPVSSAPIATAAVPPPHAATAAVAAGPNGEWVSVSLPPLCILNGALMGSVDIT
jgi:hypothetical protein